MLTPDEHNVLNLLVSAWNAFQKLDNHGPWDRGDFMEGIHKSQSVIGLKVATRANPEVWINHHQKKGGG